MLRRQLTSPKVARLRLLVRALVVIVLATAVSFSLAGSALSSGITRPSLTKLNDANHDGTFSAVENVPRNVTYPWTVTYQLTLYAGSSSHRVDSISDSSTSAIGTCQALVGTTIPAGGSASCTYSVTLSGARSQPLVNTAAWTYDLNRRHGDIARGSSTVNFPAISLTKSSTTTLITSVGQVVQYAYVISNTGTSALTGIALSDDNTDLAPSCPSTSLAVGASMTCTARHTVTARELAAGGELVNVATVTSNEAPDQEAKLSIPIAAVDLAITKSGSPSPDRRLGAITWKMVVTNNGPDTDTGVTVSDAIPSRNSLVSVETTQGTCVNGTTLRCEIGTMAKGSTVTITLITKPAAPGKVKNTATVTGDARETNTANNTASASVLVTEAFTPPKTHCTAISVRPRQLYVGRRSELRLRLTSRGKAVRGMKVKVRGPAIRIVTRRSNRHGFITFSLRPTKAGPVSFKPVRTKACKAVRIGVTETFTPPVTG